jgi:hypothetical protein
LTLAAKWVIRRDLQATLGQNVAWNEITLEMTDELVTTWIVRKLPWFACKLLRNAGWFSLGVQASRDR